MSWRCLSAWLILGCIVFLTYCTAGRDVGLLATVSRHMTDTAKGYPLVTLIAGVLLGHLFAHRDK